MIHSGVIFFCNLPLKDNFRVIYVNEKLKIDATLFPLLPCFQGFKFAYIGKFIHRESLNTSSNSFSNMKMVVLCQNYTISSFTYSNTLSNMRIAVSDVKSYTKPHLIICIHVG